MIHAHSDLGAMHPAAAVMERLHELRAGDLPTHGGRTLSYVYDSGISSADQLGRVALAEMSAANALDPTAFPSLRAMESELVALAAGVLDAPDRAVGVASSGGTESIILAVLAARDGSPEIDRPQMVIPSSAHAAFHKAGHLLGVEVVAVPVDPETRRADIAATEAALTDRTVLVVASAPSYAHGVIDPIPDLAALAATRGIRCHVDACIGGWVLPFLDEEEGRMAWTFAVDGVTSISVDLHKYGYTPKGVSLLLHRDAALRRGQLFASAAWPGYTMLNTTIQSTRSGGPLAAAWAVTTFLGVDGYRRLAQAARDATLRVTEAVTAIDGLDVFVAPDSTLLALQTDQTCDVFTIADEMLERGWYAQPQMSFEDARATLHLTTCAATAQHVDELLEVLASSVAAAREVGPIQVDPDLAAAARAIDPMTLDEAAFDGLLAIAGLSGEGSAIVLPRRMAPVNALLDLTPPALREALLLEVLDRLSR